MIVDKKLEEKNDIKTLINKVIVSWALKEVIREKEVLFKCDQNADFLHFMRTEEMIEFTVMNCGHIIPVYNYIRQEVKDRIIKLIKGNFKGSELVKNYNLSTNYLTDVDFDYLIEITDILLRDEYKVTKE